MIWLASLFGLMAMGGVIFVDDDEVESSNSEDGEDESGAVSDLAGPDTVQPLTGLLPGNGPTQGNDVISGSTDEDILSGGDGSDQINGYDGDDRLDGGNGDDHLFGGDGADTVVGGDGADLMHGAGGNDQMHGDGGSDSLFGHFGNDLIEGGTGDDTAHGGQDDDTLSGGAGNDALHGNYGDDTLVGGSGLDTLFGGVGNDLVLGADDGDTRDFVNGGEGNDTLIAGANDILTLGDGADQVMTGSWINEGDAIEIMDFDSAEDQLVLLWDLEGQPDPDIDIEADPGTPDHTIIRINGIEVLRVNAAAGITPEDIVLLDQADSALYGLSAP